jgi:hypothetical protein
MLKRLGMKDAVETAQSGAVAVANVQP